MSLAISCQSHTFCGTQLSCGKLSKHLVKFHQRFTARLPSGCCAALLSVLYRISTAVTAIFVYPTLGILTIASKISTNRAAAYRARQAEFTKSIHAQVWANIAELDKSQTSYEYPMLSLFACRHPRITVPVTDDRKVKNRQEYIDHYQFFITERIMPYLKQNSLGNNDYILENVRITQAPSGNYTFKADFFSQINKTKKSSSAIKILPRDTDLSISEFLAKMGIKNIVMPSDWKRQIVKFL